VIRIEAPAVEAPAPECAVTEEDLALLREVFGAEFVTDWVARYADNDNDDDEPGEDDLA